MKKIVLIIILFSIGFFANAQGKKQAQETFYTCVMHPEIHSPKPGKCPDV